LHYKCIYWAEFLSNFTQKINLPSSNRSTNLREKIMHRHNKHLSNALPVQWIKLYGTDSVQGDPKILLLTCIWMYQNVINVDKFIC